MDIKLEDAFVPGCDLCPQETKTKCAALAGEIASLEGMAWPDSLVHERDKLISQRLQNLIGRTGVPCPGPWQVREEGNMLVCGRDAGVVVIGGKHKGVRAIRYRRITGSDYGSPST